MMGIKYRMARATSGEISNMPSLGIIRLSGDSSGSVMSSSKAHTILVRANANHDTIDRIMTATAKIWQR